MQNGRNLGVMNAGMQDAGMRSIGKYENEMIPIISHYIIILWLSERLHNTTSGGSRVMIGYKILLPGEVVSKTIETR